MSPPKHHNIPLSHPKHAIPRPPIETAQEAVGPVPGPHPAPDARGNLPRKKPRGLAPSGATLLASDACDNLSQKKARTPAPDQGRSRRGRRDPQNRDGSRNPGFAEGSLSRLAPDGQDFEQEIVLLRSLINRLLSKRPLNHTYISRYMRLLIQAIAAGSRIPKEPTDTQEIDALIKKVFQKSVDEGRISFFDILPVRKARPGDKWWPWRHLLPLWTRREYGLIDPQDPWPREVEEHFAMIDALDKAESDSLDEPFDDDEPDYPDLISSDPDNYPPPLDQDEQPADPGHHFLPLDQDEQPSNPDDHTVIPDPDRVADAESAPGRAPRRESIPQGVGGNPTPSPSMGEGWGRRLAEESEGAPFPNDHLPAPLKPRRTAIGRPRPP